MAAVNPHPMSPNLRTAEEVFSADSPVWRPALGWDFLSYKLPIMELWDVAERLSLMAPVAVFLPDLVEGDAVELVLGQE